MADAVGYSEEAFTNTEWETVHTEAPDQLVFDEVGDSYIGKYEGHEVIHPDLEKEPDKTFIQLQFSDPDGMKVVNSGYELQTTFVRQDEDSLQWSDIVAPGTMCRIILKKFVDVKQASPMKSYQVDVARSSGATEHAGNKRK